MGLLFMEKSLDWWRIKNGADTIEVCVVSALFLSFKWCQRMIWKDYETVPFLLHEIVTLCVKSFEELGDECVAVAYAVAEFPFLEEDMDLIDQVVAGAVALGEQLMQREVVPS